MKRLSTGVLAALIAAGSDLTRSRLRRLTQRMETLEPTRSRKLERDDRAPPANFGSPPSGQIPILFNDHHVYAKPDDLKQGRVLAALVRGGTILIPLRSMFEQMGATVSYDPATQDGRRYQTRRRRQSDGRQTRSRHQRRNASAGRAAEMYQGTSSFRSA